MCELTLEELDQPSPSHSNGRGRPVGVKNGEGKGLLAPIKNWKLMHESIVHLHMSGWKAERIAAYISQKAGRTMSVTRISQVLQDPRAKAIIAETQAQMREKMSEDITGELVVLAEESVKRLGETVRMQFPLGSDAKKHQDNVALALTKGFLPGNQSEDGGKEARIPVSLASKLMDALLKSNEADKVQEAHQKSKEIVVVTPHEVLISV